jgi:hypothetical protein
LIDNFHVFVIKKKNLILAAACFLACLGLLVFSFGFFWEKSDAKEAVQQNKGYVILAANDLGMHCYQKSYSAFLLLPPGNNIIVQVFKKGSKEAKLVNSGVTVSYSIIDNANSADKINFWDYAKDYGYDVPPNIGITGNSLSGLMQLSQDKKYYQAPDAFTIQA